MRSLAIAIQFLTRIPVRLKSYPSEHEIGHSLNYYPLVGLILGLLLFATAWLLQVFPSLFAAVLLCVVWVGLTGALHLDGLADSADAWVGGLGDKKKTLAIMKDPACGPAGVIAIVLLLLFKLAALQALIDAKSIQWLFVAPLLSRSCVMLMIAITPNARHDGLAVPLIKHANPMRQGLLLLLIVALLLILMGTSLMLILLALLLFNGVFRRAIMRRVNGITGDLAGALVELSEAVILLGLVGITYLP